MESVTDNVSNVVDKVSDLISGKTEFIFKQVINAILVLIILLIFGCLDFANLSFHFERLGTPSFWSTVGLKCVGVTVCAFNLGINFLWDSEIKKDSALHKAKSIYDKIIDYLDIDFEEFVLNVYNPQEKKKTYINKINRKIYLLNKFNPKKFQIDYNKNKQPKGWLESRYFTKRNQYKYLSSDEYIDKNLEIIRIHYKAVDPTIFKLEIDGSASTGGKKTKGNVFGGRAKATSSVVLTGFLITSFFTALSMEFDNKQFEDQMNAFFNYCLHCALDVGLVLWQVTRGMFTCKKIISDEITKPYQNRNDIITLYFDWRIKNNKEVSKAKEKIDSLTIEKGTITAEEYAKIMEDREHAKRR